MEVLNIFKPLKEFNYVLIVAMAGNLLALTGDTTITWASPVLPKLFSNDTTTNPLKRPITEDEESWIGSLIYVGAMCGAIPFGYLANKIGRKPTLLLLALPHITAYLMFAFATKVELFYVGRILGGISLSSVYVILPMYVAEIAEDSYRGMILVSYTTFASFGDLLPYLIGPFLSMLSLNIIICVFPVLFLFMFYLVAPESPYYFLLKNDMESARDSLIKLKRYGEYNMDMELEIIMNETHQPNEDKIIDILKSKHVIKGFIIALLLTVFAQLSGISAILDYTEIIFEEAGTGISAELSSIIVGIVLFLGSFFGPFLVDKKGRKFLLICSAIGMIVSQAGIGAYFYIRKTLNYDTTSFSFLPLLCLMIYTLTFNVGFGPLPFTITSEILPSSVKFLVATVAGVLAWLVSFLLTRFYNNLDDALGIGETFWLLCGICTVALLFVIFFVPETKGKSFQEIQRILEG